MTEQEILAGSRILPWQTAETLLASATVDRLRLLYTSPEGIPVDCHEFPRAAARQMQAGDMTHLRLALPSKEYVLLHEACDEVEVRKSESKLNRRHARLAAWAVFYVAGAELKV